jgi:ribosome biogenesis GTPase
MPRKRKSTREKDFTAQYLSGALDEDRLESGMQRFTDRSKHQQQNKILRTAMMRAEEETLAADLESLPVGRVVQVHSLFSEVEHESKIYLCVLRKTLLKVGGSAAIVGDEVKFRAVESREEIPGTATPEGVIEQILPRRTILTRADSFKAIDADPIVANADQVLIVASLAFPRVKWGLVDRMIIAAQAGGLVPVLCLNKIDAREQALKEWEFAEPALAHYASMAIQTLQTSVPENLGIDSVRDILRAKETVLAGHSGVGKSSLIRAIEPDLDIRVGEISRYTEKGRHTTTSARRYALSSVQGVVIDTPGVKLFGLWNVTRENLIDYFPDVVDDSAPAWRQESYERIESSLPE